MSLEEISNYIDNKIRINPDILIFTFYEIRVKLNLYQDESEKFLYYVKTRLENLGYYIYITGQKYYYQNISKTVNSNELMVAVKKNVKKISKHPKLI